MKALVYHGPGNKSWEDVPRPRLVESTDAIVRVDAVTICGTDLHILKGDVPEVTEWPRPRPRSSRHRRRGRVGCRKERPLGRPRPRIVHHRLRFVPFLPSRAVSASASAAAVGSSAT